MALSFSPLAVQDAVQVTSLPARDARGAFIRSWSEAEFAAAGIGFRPILTSLSENTAKHTLRGMHWQAAPHGETKLVRCLHGAVLDVILDLRPDSPSYLQHVAVELSAANREALLIPRGCAHGFLTLTEHALVEYHIDAPWVAEAGRGVRWDDPAFGIAWPARPAVIAERDASYPDYRA